ncbi:hypothetical protein ACK3TF_000652 [Chlorella vulgaris]
MQAATCSRSPATSFAWPIAPRLLGPRPVSCKKTAQQRRWPYRASAEPDTSSGASTSSSSSTAGDLAPETTFYEGSGSNAELLLSLVLGATLIYLPLTLASIGRRLWISYRFTDKRLIVTTNSPVLKREVQVKYSQIKEVRSAPRALGLWGDIVIFLKDGSRLPLVGLERHRELVDYIEGQIQ